MARCRVWKGILEQITRAYDRILKVTRTIADLAGAVKNRRRLRFRGHSG
jgi:predicted ATPase with chaperone activity